MQLEYEKSYSLRVIAFGFISIPERILTLYIASFILND
jgi:hypothetical protein